MDARLSFDARARSFTVLQAAGLRNFHAFGQVQQSAWELYFLRLMQPA
jgi:hypothetical protein